MFWSSPRPITTPVLKPRSADQRESSIASAATLSMSVAEEDLPQFERWNAKPADRNREVVQIISGDSTRFGPLPFALAPCATRQRRLRPFIAAQHPFLKCVSAPETVQTRRHPHDRDRAWLATITNGCRALVFPGLVGKPLFKENMRVDSAESEAGEHGPARSCRGTLGPRLRLLENAERAGAELQPGRDAQSGWRSGGEPGLASPARSSRAPRRRRPSACGQHWI